MHAALARITLATGAVFHALEKDTIGQNVEVARWWNARAAEAPLWACVAALWALPSGSAAVAATNAWAEMDAWEARPLTTCRCSFMHQHTSTSSSASAAACVSCT